MRITGAPVGAALVGAAGIASGAPMTITPKPDAVPPTPNQAAPAPPMPAARAARSELKN